MAEVVPGFSDGGLKLSNKGKRPAVQRRQTVEPMAKSGE